KKNFTLGSGVAILGILILFLVKSPSSPWMPYLYAGLFGLGLGIVGPTLTAAVADIFHGKHFGSINGFLILGFGVGGVIGPWVGGYIFDRTHSYNYAFLVTILALIVASSLIWVVSPGKRSNSGTDK
ncbi:MFS transporter, partial [Candidatus Aerophobetes bacterium]